MAKHVLQREQFPAGVPGGGVWEFFSTPRNLARITPADMGFPDPRTLR